MQAGKLRYRVRIEEPTEAQDSYGEPTQTWSKLLDVWASREDLTGREQFLAQQVRADNSTRFELRYVEGITGKMRLTCEDIVYNIASVADPDGRKRKLVIVAARTS